MFRDSITDQNNFPDGATGAADLRAARNASIGASLFDRINAYAVREGNPGGFEVAWRQYYLDNLVGSIIAVPANPPGEDNIGFAGEPDLNDATPSQVGFLDPQFANVLKRMLQRNTVCPSDYNRDLAQDPFVDGPQFINGVVALDPYADWNFDTILDGATVGGLDNEKFFHVFQAMMSCP
ncbi:MAG: hypothetical protein IT437_04740 [Phycisphaerales bacterium]|nr:hypothetical protein [Phycisphaerales bacterium]